MEHTPACCLQYLLNTVFQCSILLHTRLYEGACLLINFLNKLTMILKTTPKKIQLGYYSTCNLLVSAIYYITLSLISNELEFLRKFPIFKTKGSIFFATVFRRFTCTIVLNWWHTSIKAITTTAELRCMFKM